MDFEIIFDYFFEHAWEIVLGLEMLFLRLFRKKTPEQIQAKKEQRENKRLEKEKRKLRKVLEKIDVSALNEGGEENGNV